MMQTWLIMNVWMSWSEARERNWPTENKGTSSGTKCRNDLQPVKRPVLKFINMDSCVHVVHILGTGYTLMKGRLNFLKFQILGSKLS